MIINSSIKVKQFTLQVDRIKEASIVIESLIYVVCMIRTSEMIHPSSSPGSRAQKQRRTVSTATLQRGRSITRQHYCCYSRVRPIVDERTVSPKSRKLCS
jgi:hypothetical protein